MFKPLFDRMEKLIIEHGSSAAKIATLEQQLREWKEAAETAGALARVFETENTHLRLEILKMRDDMKVLNKILDSRPPTAPLLFDSRKSRTRSH